MKKPEFQSPLAGTIDIRGTRRPTGTILAAAAASILLGGCLQKEPPFEVTATGNSAYLLNKETGELKFIDGTRLLPVEAPSTGVSASGSAKTWGVDQPPGAPGVSVSLRTKYRDGQMLYVARATPYAGLIETTRSNRLSGAAFSIYLADSDNFPVGEMIDLLLRDGTPLVGSDGKPGSLEWSGSQAMSASDYAAIAGTATGWRGFPAAE